VKMKQFIVLALALACVSASFLDAPAISKDDIDAINAANVGWKAGVNEKFASVTLREAQQLCGAILTDKVKLPEVTYDEVGDLPESFDAREQWPQCRSIGHIRDQANCGSCWAIAAAEAWSDRVCIETDGADTQPMSTTDILTCCGRTCGSGCNGGYLSGAWSYIKSIGLVSGGDFGDRQTCSPYMLKPCDHHVNGTYGPCPDTVPTPACNAKCQASYTQRDWNADKRKAVTVYSVSGEKNIMNEIYNHGPIEAAFTVYSDFLTYKSGVYRHVKGSYLGGHAIKIIGWGVENGDKYWLIANSWNEGWGDNGLFKIKKGDCGIDNQGYAGRLKN